MPSPIITRTGHQGKRRLKSKTGQDRIHRRWSEWMRRERSRFAISAMQTDETMAAGRNLEEWGYEDPRFGRRRGSRTHDDDDDDGGGWPSHQADRLSVQISKSTVTSRAWDNTYAAEGNSTYRRERRWGVQNLPPAVPREQVQYRLKGIVYTVQHVQRDEGRGEIQSRWMLSDRTGAAT